MSAVVYEFPVTADPRMQPVADRPDDVLALVERAEAAADHLAALIERAAPAPEITAAAEALAAVRGPLAGLKSTAALFSAALHVYRGGGAQLRAVPASPQDHATGCAIAPGGQAPGGAA